MTIPHDAQNLGKSLPVKKKRSAVFVVIIVSIAVHVVGIGGLAAIKIIEVLQPEQEEFEAPPVVPIKPPPPPPPPPPTTKRAQRSLPRPQPLAVRNPQNMSVPSIEMNSSNVTVGGGRGFGGGLGDVGGAVSDALRLTITSFGYNQAVEGTLEGSLFDFKQGKKKGDPGVGRNQMLELIKNATERDFDTNKLRREVYKADTQLYASYFMIPLGDADRAPQSFGAEGEVEPRLLAAIYSGTFTPAQSGRFRFLGLADDLLIVSVNGRLVLDASLDVVNLKYANWKKDDPSDVTEWEHPNGSRFIGLGGTPKTGDWFDLKAGVETKMEVLIGEVPGGKFGGYLLIEKKGSSKPKVFSTRRLSSDDKKFLRDLHPDIDDYL